MSNPLTKYVAAAAVAGAVAFGGFTIASAQDGGSTTTAPPATSPGEQPQGTAPDGARPEGGAPDGTRPEGGCDRDKGESGSNGPETNPEQAPSTSSSGSTSTESSFTST